MNTIIKTGLFFALFLFSFSTFAQKKTQDFTVSQVIKATAEKVWAVVGEDYGAIANSHPGIVSSDYISGSLQGGEGAERVCYLNDKETKYTHEKQVSYDPENYSFTAQVFAAEGIPMDPDYTSATYRVEPIDANSSRLVIEMKIRTKPAVLGAMAKGKFKKTMQDYTLAVMHHVMTGEQVTKDNFKEIKKNYNS